MSKDSVRSSRDNCHILVSTLDNMMDALIVQGFTSNYPLYMSLDVIFIVKSWYTVAWRCAASPRSDMLTTTDLVILTSFLCACSWGMEDQ